MKEKKQWLTEQLEKGKMWLSSEETGEILGLHAYSLNTAAKQYGNLGTLQYTWCGSSLKVSTASVLRFICGK